MTSRSDPGFTLTEMLVVLAILSLVGGLALRQDWASVLGGARLDSTAQRLASGLRRARAEAMADGIVTGVIFDLPHQRVTRWPRRFEETLPDGVTLQVSTGADASAGQAEPVTIVFGPDGASQGAAIRLTAGDRTRWVRLDWLTGRVDVAP